MYSLFCTEYRTVRSLFAAKAQPKKHAAQRALMSHRAPATLLPHLLETCTE